MATVIIGYILGILLSVIITGGVIASNRAARRGETIIHVTFDLSDTKDDPSGND